jgi:hypothetical protein
MFLVNNIICKVPEKLEQTATGKYYFKVRGHFSFYLNEPKHYCKIAVELKGNTYVTHCVGLTEEEAKKEYGVLLTYNIASTLDFFFCEMLEQFAPIAYKATDVEDCLEYSDCVIENGVSKVDIYHTGEKVRRVEVLRVPFENNKVFTLDLLQSSDGEFIIRRFLQKTVNLREDISFKYPLGDQDDVELFCENLGFSNPNLNL